MNRIDCLPDNMRHKDSTYKTITHKLLLLLMLVGVASCSSEIGEVYPDGSEEIRISIGKGISTRTSDPDYRAWDVSKDPTTMGVIAFADDSKIFDNTEFTASAEGDIWTTTGEKKYWASYSNAASLDFFAYMPHVAGATISNSADTYTLTLTNVPGIAIKPYLVAAAPVHYASALGNTTPVAIHMDQLMTGFEFQFALGEDMSDLRTFRITKVKMSHVTTSATVEQYYTFADGAWAKGDMTITHTASDHQASAEITGNIVVGYANVEKTAFVSFPGMLYMLPFNLGEMAPKIEVTYDVYDQEGYRTRTETSEIVLNEANFGTLGTVESAHRNTIKIKIVPNSLKVLSDADQSTSGYLVVNKKLPPTVKG